MATMEEKIAKIMDYTGVSVGKVLALDDYRFDEAYICAVNIEENLKVLKNLGLELEEADEDCGCGGCEITLADCIAESESIDELVELEQFIGAVRRLIKEQRRAKDEMQ